MTIVVDLGRDTKRKKNPERLTGRNERGSIEDDTKTTTKIRAIMMYHLIALRLPVVAVVAIVMIVMIENKRENDIKRNLRGKGASTKEVRRRKNNRERATASFLLENKNIYDKKLVAALC